MQVSVPKSCYRQWLESRLVLMHHQEMHILMHAIQPSVALDRGSFCGPRKPSCESIPGSKLDDD